VATALRPAGGTAGAGVFAAGDYHELADAMTFVGRFSLDSLVVDAKWIRVAVWPADAYSAVAARTLRASIERIAKTQNRLMNGAPYDTYTIFFNVFREPIPFAGGLEHAASQFDIMPASGFVDETGTLGAFMNPLMSHEFFHLWNVKRIRPAELWPYDYHAEQYTPLLWWSEGVTDYFADLTNVRAGLWTDGEFIASLDGNIRQIETAPEPWSPEDGSAATWIDEVFVQSSQLYYPKGSVLGLLMDIAIRDATDNAKSLDDVIRTLNVRFARQGKGFTTADLLAVLREVGMPDVDGFYRRYIDGREPLPYEQLLPKVGIAVTRRAVTSPTLGVSSRPGQDGRVVVEQVTSESAAEAAGVAPGDVLLRVGDVEVSASVGWAGEFRTRYRGRAGAPLPIVVQRGDERLTLSGVVREVTLTQVSVARADAPDARAARLWRGLVSGTMGR
jgi:predicted metalloprotease with PDZ domain